MCLYLRPGSQPVSSSHSGCETPAFDRGCSAAFERFLVLLGIGYFALIFTNAFASALEPIYRVLADADRLVRGSAALGLGVGASPFRAIGAVGFTGVFVVVAVVSLYRLSEWLWYADGVHITHEVERSDDRSSRFNGLSRILFTASLRCRRSRLETCPPVADPLSFALYPLIVLAGPIVTAVQTGEIGTGLPLWVLLTGTWVAGSLFALNVVGQEGAALPSHCSQRPPSAHWSPDTSSLVPLLIAPITVAATVTAGILSPHSVPVVASLGVSALVLSAVSGAIGTGIGVGLPRFEAVSVSRSTKAIVPSAFAFAIYSVAVLIVALPAVIAHSGIAGHALASAVGVNRFVIGPVGHLFRLYSRVSSVSSQCTSHETVFATIVSGEQPVTGLGVVELTHSTLI